METARDADGLAARMELESVAAMPPTASVAEDYFLTLRRTEYGRLDGADHAYLDYTGAGLYAASQIEAHQRGLEHEVLGNPHSGNPASAASTERLERARQRVLGFLRADPEVYDVVFSANASAALRLVAESFPFGTGSRFVLTRDNHNSVNGIRCYAERAGAQVGYVPLDARLRAMEPGAWLKPATLGGAHLFAYPAQSNYSGVRHPLAWIASAADHVQAPEMLEDHVALLTDEAADELLALDDALERLARANARAARVVEQRFFAGLTLEETADVLDVSLKTVQRDWILARAWLRKEIALDLAAADPDSRLS